MTRDFAKRSKKTTTQPKRKVSNKRKRPAQKKQTPAWIWLLVGMLLSGFIIFLIYLSVQKPNQTSKPTAKPTIKTSEPEKTKLEFYERLKNEEVPIVTKQAVANTKPTTPVNYYLQVGSFRSEADAQSHRARVLLMNLNAHIETGDDGSGNKRFRVITGPYSNNSQMASARSKLVSEKIDTLVLKREVK